MEWLNYHHLLYFWTVVREGTIGAAAEQLHLSRPTISGQIRRLEQSLGGKLFVKSGRHLQLTEFGQMVYRFADEIFTTGRELQDAVRGRPTGRPLRFVVGLPDVLPKLIAFRLLEPALAIPEPVHLVCREGKFDDLLADLAVHRLDLLLSDAPVGPTTSVRAYNHKLGECGVTFLAKKQLAAKYRRRFPESLHGAPVLFPTSNTSLRRSLDHWLDSQGLSPRIQAEFEDSALLKVFGQSGMGLFPAPTAIENEVREQYKASVVGRLDEVRETYYAISVERRLKHPAVLAISEAARRQVFV